MANTIRIKRRAWSSGGSSGAPSSLQSGELAYNENDRTLYIGSGSAGGATVLPVAGDDLNYFVTDSDNTASGDNTFSGTLNVSGTFQLDGTEVTSTAAELNHLDNVTSNIQSQLNGKQSTLTFGIANDNAVEIDDTDAAADDFAVFTANGLKGLDAGEVRSQLDLEIGTDVQAFDADLTTIAGLANTDGNFIVGNGSTWVAESGNAARTSLGLGTTDSPTFTGLTLSEDLTLSTGDVVITDGVLQGPSRFIIDPSPYESPYTSPLVNSPQSTGEIVIRGDLEVEGYLTATFSQSSNDLDKFLVADGGTVYYRTGAQVRSDIGAQAQDDLLQDIADITGTATAANQFIVSTGVGTFQLDSGATVRTSLGLGSGDSPTFTGLTLSGDLNVNGGDITSDSETFNFLTDNSALHTLNIGDTNTATTFPGEIYVTTGIDSAGITLGSNQEFVVDSSGNVSTSGTLAASFAAATTDTDAFLVSDSGTVKRRTGAELRSDIGVDPAGTDNSTDVTLAGTPDYITISGQVITRNLIDLANDVTGTLPAANVGNLSASKITSGTFANARISSASVTQHQDNITSVGTLDDLQVTGDVTVSTGDVAITAGNLIGPSTFYIDPAPNDSPHNDNSTAATGTVVIRGDLQVDGTTTTINSTEISITDRNMVLADDQTDLAGVDNAGLYLGDNGAGEGEVNFVYDSSNTRMEITGTSNIGLYVSGGLKDTVIDGGTF